jgi:hypothetical protein
MGRPEPDHKITAFICLYEAWRTAQNASLRHSTSHFPRNDAGHCGENAYFQNKFR